MTPKEFVDRWLDDDDGELVRYPNVPCGLSPDTLQFLADAGLPKSAAPFLSFSSPSKSKFVPVSQSWPLTDDYDHLLEIGSNGSGDPICIDPSTGKICYLNHDDRFDRVFINSSVLALAHSLLAFRHLVRETQARNGEDAFLDGNIPADLQEWFRMTVAEADPDAMRDDNFWPCELADVLANADAT